MRAAPSTDSHGGISDTAAISAAPGTQDEEEKEVDS